MCHFDVQEVTREILAPILVARMGCGLLGGLFSRVLLWPQRHHRFVLWE
ncbi:hypothetical protein [Pseudomonas moorei]